AEHAQALVQVVLEVEEMLEVRVAHDGVEVLVRERQTVNVEVDVVGRDAASRGALGADARHVGAGHLGAAVPEQLGKEARPAAGLEHALPRSDAAGDHPQAVEVDFALRETRPVMIVVVGQIHTHAPSKTSAYASAMRAQSNSRAVASARARSGRASRRAAS